MSRLLTYGLLVAFTASLPLTSSALVLQDPADAVTGPEIAVADLAVETSGKPRCDNKNANRLAADRATGGIASTEEAAPEAHATACCWFYYQGRWWCVPCS